MAQGMMKTKHDTRKIFTPAAQSNVLPTGAACGSRQVKDKSISLWSNDHNKLSNIKEALRKEELDRKTVEQVPEIAQIQIKKPHVNTQRTSHPISSNAASAGSRPVENRLTPIWVRRDKHDRP